MLNDLSRPRQSVRGTAESLPWISTWRLPLSMWLHRAQPLNVGLETGSSSL